MEFGFPKIGGRQEAGRKWLEGNRKREEGGGGRRGERRAEEREGGKRAEMIE